MLLRSEKIELAKDQQIRLVNVKRGIRGFTTVPSALYLELGLTYSWLLDQGAPSPRSSADVYWIPIPNYSRTWRTLTSWPTNAAKPRRLVEAVVSDPSRSDLSAKALDIYAQT